MSHTNIGLSDISYLAARSLEASQEMGASVAGLNTTTALTQPSGQSRGKSKVGYYAKKADNGTNFDEGQGHVRLFGEVPSVPNPKTGKAHKALGKNGERMSFRMAKDLAEGKHPTTGEVFIKPRVDANGKTKRKIGYDLQFSLPKSASILWGLGTAAAMEGSNSGSRYAKAVDMALEEATQRVLQFAHDNGMIVARRTGVRHGHESAAQVIAGTWRHSTSRSADMHCHTHNVVFNICLRNDGTTGGIDNAKLKMFGRTIKALFEGQAAFVLKRECPELAIDTSGKSWEVAGVAEVLIDEFSGGRKRVLKNAKEEFGMDAAELAKHRDVSTYINLNTRDKKEDVPPIPELLPRWQMRSMAKGYTWQAIVENVIEAGEARRQEIIEEWEEQRAEAAERGEFLPETPPALDLDQITDKAFKNLTNSYSVFEEKIILAEIAEAMMTKAGIDTFEEVVARVQASGKMVALGKKGDTVYYSTREIIEKERKLLSLGIKMQGNRAGIDADVVERFISRGKILENGKKAVLRDEQAEATRYACRGNQFVIVRGRPGTGKSFTSGVIADIHRDQGYEVHGIGPTHAAKDVLKDDAEIAAELARAVAGFILDYEKGKITLGPSSLVLIDEFGMLGLDQTHRLLEILDETGAKGVGFGDDFQLQPISNGASMKQLSDPRICGAFTMGEIVRQSGWQREASLMMSDKRVADGVSEYMKMGKVHFHDDGETAAAKTVNDYIDYRLANPDKTAIMQAILNRSTSEMNMLARERLAELGFIEGPETVIKTWTRGMNPRKTDTGFCKNDLVILGEPFKHAGEVYANNLGGKILDIKPIENGEPIFTIRWNDGRITSLRPSEMVGYRPEKAKDKTTPKLAHGYARTVYSQQGSTYNATFTNIDATPSAELVNVLLTRHKDDAIVHVDGGRYHDDIASRNGVSMAMTRDGVTNEMSSESDTEVTQDMIREQFLKEVQKSQAKLNASDFHDDIVAFANGAEITRAEDQIKAIMSWRAQEISIEEAIALSGAEDRDQVYEWADRVSEMLDAEEQREKNKMAIEDDKPQQPVTAGDFRGARNSARARARFQSSTAPTPVEEKVAERMDTKAAELQKRKASKPKKEDKEGRYVPLSDNEKDVILRTNLADYMSRNGLSFTRDKQGVSVADKSGGTAVRYTMTSDPSKKGAKYYVFEKSNGTWAYWQVGDRANKGDIRNFVMNHKGTDFVEACKRLRDEFGTHNLMERRDVVAKQIADAKPKETTREFYDRLLTTEVKAAEHITRYWNNAETKGSRYLAERGLTLETQKHYQAAFRCEGKKPYDHDKEFSNKGGIMLAMRTLQMEVVGIVRKGWELMQNDKNELVAFNRNVKGSQRHLIMGGEFKDPKVIMFGEAFIDLPSYAQKKGIVEGSLACAFAGTASDQSLAQVYQLAKENPDARLIWVGQNDEADRANEMMARAAIKEANPNAVLEVERPAEIYKDWNDDIRDKQIVASKPEDVFINNPVLKGKVEKPEETVAKKETDQAKQEPSRSNVRPQDYRPKPIYRGVTEEKKELRGSDAQEAAAAAEKARAEADAQRRTRKEEFENRGPKI
ncbi:AAA family ATPase (plasmid) [Agrobacterium tumefaciens]|uniref:MobF family relaxase n=1 Tax=Agrobacterium tumefaciens TaxID=358 RepID=UPI0021D23077|nr:MobF family relaxase [Agrobacterium tumefaciens]UXT53271.1 AAA family ATPase [Agrobacterium tumefaciens]